MGKLEHVNLTVKDPHKTAELLHQVFGWSIRWEGPSAIGGYTVHVGTQDDYIALYRNDEWEETLSNDQRVSGGFNHVGIVVEDLDLIEEKVKQAGLTTHSHQDYEPGRRFYFTDTEGVEFEVVSYQ